MADIEECWSTPIFRDNKIFDNHQDILSLAKNSTESVGYKNTVHENLFIPGTAIIKKPEIAELKNWLLDTVYEVAVNRNKGYWKTNYSPTFVDMWVWSSNNYENPLHGHANASWVGIYCLDPGDGTGALNLYSPLPWGIYTDAGNSFLEKEFVQWNNLQKGDLIMFPGYIKHSAQYRGETPRVVIAFNIMFI